MSTGNLDVRCNAMAREVLVGKDGLATGVSYIDKKTGREVQVRGKIVVLAASNCETARLLLNSKSTTHPQGLGNSSGMVGKYLMDTVGVDRSTGFFPIMQDMPRHNEDGTGGMHLYMPWWNYQKQLRHQLPFSRGFHIEFGGGQHMPGVGSFVGSERYHLGGGYGVELKRGVRKIYGAFIGFSCRGEMIPNNDSYMRNRQLGGRYVGHTCAQIPLQVQRRSDPDGEVRPRNVQEIILTAGGEPVKKFGPER